MAFIQLPAEIIRMILHYLDVKSKLCLWDAFGEFLDVRCWPGLQRVCFVRSGLTARALHSRLLREHMLEVDLSCVQNLRQASALTMLPNLRRLDVSCTDLPLKDTSAVCAACSNLTHLTIDYGHCPTDEEMQSYLAMCNSEYVHLIGKFLPLFCCSRLMEILSRWTHLKQLKITALSYKEDIHCLHDHYSADTNNLSVKIFSFHFRFCEPEFQFRILFAIPLIQHLNCDLWEHALFEFHLSKLSSLFLSPNFHSDVIAVLCLQSQTDSLLEELFLLDVDYSYDVHMWHPDLATLNPNFHDDIVREISEKIPQRIDPWNWSRLGSKKYFLMCQCTLREVYTIDVHSYTKHNKLDLNINEFIDTKIPISVQYDTCDRCHFERCKLCNVILNTNFNVLSHIVTLNMGPLKVSSDALKALLINCYRLKTLYVCLDAHNYQGFADVSSLNKTIENIRVTSGDDCYLEMILSGLSGCPLLKSVVISECEELYPSTVGLQDYLNFIKNCPNLYSYYYTSALIIDDNIISHHLAMISETFKTLGREDVIFGLVGNDYLHGKLGYFERLNSKLFQETNYLDLKVNENLIM